MITCNTTIKTRLLLFLWMGLFTFAAFPLKSQSLKILALGNSITQADDTHYSYRYPLWKKLIDDGVNFDFVGSHTSHYNCGTPAFPIYNGKTFDTDNEGHWGWRCDELINGGSSSGCAGSNYLSVWLGNYTPDIVLLHAGTNDMFQSQSVGSTISEIESMISIIRADNPHVVILLATIIPSTLTPLKDNIILLNAEIPNIAVTMADQGSPIMIVDQFTGFDANTDTQSDGVHPNDLGEEKIAENFRLAINSVLAGRWTGQTSGDWATVGNWASGMIPTASDDVYIYPLATNWPVITGDFHVGADSKGINMFGASHLTINGNLTITDDINLLGSSILTVNGNLTLEVNSKFTLEASNVLDVSGDVLIKGGPSENASFVDFGTFTNSGNTTIQNHYSGNPDINLSRWHFVGSPTDGTFSNVFQNLYMKYWDESTYSWNYVTSSNYFMEPGTAYSIWSTLGDVMVNYTGGNLNTGDISPLLSATDVNGDGFGASDGWNFISNPYPSAMDIGTENDPVSGFTWTNLDNSLYFWNGVQYAVFMRSGNGSSVNGATRFIPSMQGFFIKANAVNPQLTLPNSSRLHNGLSNYKSSEVGKQIKLRIEGNSFSDEVLISTHPNSTPGFDSHFDAYKLPGIEEAPQLFIRLPNSHLTINTIPKIDDSTMVPLGFSVGKEDAYSISLINSNGFAEDQDIFLIDLELNTFTNFRKHATYYFDATPGEPENRFELYFSSLEDIEIVSDQLLRVYSTENTIRLELNTAGKSDIEIYNLTGQLLTKKALNHSGVFSFHVSSGTGYYLVKVRNGNQSANKKVFVK